MFSNKLSIFLPVIISKAMPGTYCIKPAGTLWDSTPHNIIWLKLLSLMWCEATQDYMYVHTLKCALYICFPTQCRTIVQQDKTEAVKWCKHIYIQGLYNNVQTVTL